MGPDLPILAVSIFYVVKTLSICKSIVYRLVEAEKFSTIRIGGRRLVTWAIDKILSLVIHPLERGE